VDVVNATGRNGLAGALEQALTTTGFTPGVASTAYRHLSSTTIYYPGPGSTGAAGALAGLLGGLPTAQDPTVPAGHLRVVLGTGYSMPPVLTTAARGHSPGTAAPARPAPPPGAASNGDGPDTLPGAGIPCVK
jgi:hypothetical protein